MDKTAQMDKATWSPEVVSRRAFTSKCLVFRFPSVNYYNLKPYLYTKQYSCFRHTTMRVGLSGAALLADQNLLLDSQNGTNTNTLGSPKRSISESPRKEDGAGSSRIRKNVLEKRQQLPMEDPSRRSYQGRKELASDVPQPAFSTSVCGGGSLQYQGIFSQGFRVGLATADHLLPRAKPNA
ncbi:MAG: hypothetical protein CL912_18080 [Deltaproteobacteria bacterium]|nr:hypothetical protein [Deltaproteobacteria bacterium]|tara:strand:- start:1077 stop:1619 length:543 start_codon:yes stop_codon:yes gene_type:complete